MRTIHARLAVLVSALLLAAPFAAAQGPARQVIDDVGFWSDAAKAKANLKIAEIKRLFDKDLVIEAAAAPKLPAGIDAGDNNSIDSFYERWAQHRYEELRVEGVYVVVVPSKHKIRFEIGRAAQARHFFTTENGNALIKQISPLLAKNRDEALQETAQFIESRMKENHATSPLGAGQAQRGNPAEHGGGGGGGGGGHAGSGWGTLWTIVGVAIVAWIVFAVIRGIMGMSRGGQQGYPGGGGYGGGGSFFSNMLGGMFGAAAGMYLYNSFFGHGNSAWGAGGGDYGATSDPNAGDGTATGGGGDYGDSGNATGGGGDWGGGDTGSSGGDWGGGGDFGGGGGDFGGGGGGDW